MPLWPSCTVTNAPPRGHKFSIGLINEAGVLIGVAMVGRPVARALDDGFTAEVNRTCTDGSANANSALYGAAWRACKGMGYTRIVTYTQYGESGASLRAAGWVKVADLAARTSWAECTADERLKKMRDGTGTGGVARIRWEISVSGRSVPDWTLPAGVGEGDEAVVDADGGSSLDAQDQLFNLT